MREGHWNLIAYRTGAVKRHNSKDGFGESYDRSQVHVTTTKELTTKLIEWKREMEVEQYSGFAKTED